MTKKNEVVETEVQNNDAVVLGDFAEFAGAGLEEVTAQDIKMPYIAFLQPQSPQVIKGNTKYIKGAESGDVLVTNINRLYKADEDGITDLNVAVIQKTTLLTEWLPERAGLVGYHSITEKDNLHIKKLPKATGKGETLVLPNGNEIQETDYLACVAIPQNKGEAPFFCIMAMSQTKRSAVRQLYTKLMFDCQGSLPTFAFVYNVGTSMKQKDTYSYAVPMFTKVLDAEYVLSQRGIINTQNAMGKEIFNACVSLSKTIKDLGGLDKLLSRNSSNEYEEADETTESASEVI